MQPVGVVHVVIGETGQYADYTQWIVAAFNDGEAARQYAENAASWVDKNKDKLLDSLCDLTSAYDPNIRFDPQTGTSYHIKTIPFYGNLT